MVISYLMPAKFKRENKLKRVLILYACFVKDNCAGIISFDFNFKGKDDENHEYIY